MSEALLDTDAVSEKVSCGVEPKVGVVRALDCAVTVEAALATAAALACGASLADCSSDIEAHCEPDAVGVAPRLGSVAVAQAEPRGEALGTTLAVPSAPTDADADSVAVEQFVMTTSFDGKGEMDALTVKVPALVADTCAVALALSDTSSVG